MSDQPPPSSAAVPLPPVDSQPTPQSLPRKPRPIAALYLRAAQAADGPVPAQQPEPSLPLPAAMASRRARYGYLAAVALVTLVLDQVSKAVIRGALPLGDSIPVLPPVLYLTHTTNRGVAFGLFRAFGDVFIFVALVIMAAIFLYYRSLRGRHLLLRTALGMQLGGALGNLTDRLRFGEVTDFLDLRYAGNNIWPVFNVADSAIVVGVGILLYCLVLRDDGKGS